MMTPSFYREVVASLAKSAALENYLENRVDAHVLETKVAHDVQLFARVKEAGILDQARAALATPAGKALTPSAAITAPVAAGGAYLLHRGGEEARDTATTVRDRALQTALGVGGVGAGLMALHHFTGAKQASATNEDADVLLEKLATVGFLDTMLEAQEKNADVTVQRDAHDCRRLNAEHGVAILRQLLP